MRTLAGALDCGLISPVLAELWCKANNLPSPYHAALWRQVSLISFLLGTIFVSNFFWLGQKWTHDAVIPFILCIIGLIMTLCSFLLFIAWIIENKRADSKFLRDCTQLSSFLLQAGYYGKIDLYKKARERMIFFVSDLIATEKCNGIGHSNTEFCRDMLKRRHATMLRFGLVNEKWDEYFAEAQTKG